MALNGSRVIKLENKSVKSVLKQLFWCLGPSTNEARPIGAGVSLGTNGPVQYFVTGGKWALSSEAFNGTSWIKIPAPMPIWALGITKINETTLLIAGGFPGKIKVSCGN